MTPRGAIYSREDAKRIKRYVDEAMKQRDAASKTITNEFRQIRPVVFENTEPETMPEFACFYITEAVVEEQTPQAKYPLHQAKKPDAALIPHLVFLNGPLEVGQLTSTNDRGSAQQHEFLTARYDSTAPSEVGRLVGPVAGQWYMSENNPIAGTHRFVADLGDNLMLVRKNEPSDFFRVKMVQTSGDNGDDQNGNTFQYTVRDLQGTLIGANVQLNSGSVHDYITPELGEIIAATSGMAYYNDSGDLIIYHCNEQLRFEAC